MFHYYHYYYYVLIFFLVPTAEASPVAAEDSTGRCTTGTRAPHASVEVLPRLSAATVRKFSSGNRLPVLYSHLHRQGSRHRITGTTATAPRQRQGRFSR